MLDKSPILDFLDTKKYREQKIFKEEIKEKLKLLDFEDFVLMTYSNKLRLFLSVGIDLLKNFNLVTKNKAYNLKEGCEETMTKAQFKKFIENNKNFEYLVSCDNILTLEEIKKKFIENYNAKSFLSLNNINMFEEVIKPLNMIDAVLCRKIYLFIFPNDEKIFINKRFSFLNKIPKSILFNGKNVRVFFINAHGKNCYLESYAKTKRIDISKIIRKYNENIALSRRALKLPYEQSEKRQYLKDDKLTIFNNQPVGRFSILESIHLFNELFSSHFRKNILDSLLSSYKREHFSIIEDLFNIYEFRRKRDYIGTSGTSGTFEEQVNNFENLLQYEYIETLNTTKKVVNFTKYNYKNSPPNVKYTFNINNEKEPLLGIFELNRDNESTIQKLLSLTSNKSTKNREIKMGLNTKEIFEYRGDIPNDYEDIIKYNKKIIETKKTSFSLQDFVSIILENSNIKNDEHVVIFSNHCRGLQDTHLITENFNTYVNFPKKSQKKIDKLRRNSINRAEKSLKPYDIIDYSQFMTKPKTKTKTKRRKRGTKRKGAKRSNILIYSDN